MLDQRIRRRTRIALSSTESYLSGEMTAAGLSASFKRVPR
jgi:hypothetical protein